MQYYRCSQDNNGPRDGMFSVMEAAKNSIARDMIPNHYVVIKFWLINIGKSS